MVMVITEHALFIYDRHIDEQRKGWVDSSMV